MWFRRNDGQMFEASENSASFQMMSKSAEFDEVIEVIETENVDLSELVNNLPEDYKQALEELTNASDEVENSATDEKAEVSEDESSEGENSDQTKNSEETVETSETEETLEKVENPTSDQPSEPETNADEIDTKIEQPALENAGTPQDSGQSSAGKRGGTRSRNKAKDSDGNENGQAVS